MACNMWAWENSGAHLLCFPGVTGPIYIIADVGVKKVSQNESILTKHAWCMLWEYFRHSAASDLPQGKIVLDSWCVHQGLAAMSAMSLSSPVAEAWSQSEQLVSRASKGRMIVRSGDCICREDLIPNEEVISPVLGILGLRTTVDCIFEHVEMFMHWARPRGKGSVSSP